MGDVVDVIARGRNQALRVLTDEGQLLVDADGNDDATIDPDTLTLINPTDATTFWSGACQVRPLTAQDVPAAPGTTERVGRYLARLPYNAPVPPRGVATVLVLSVSQDPGLVGVRLRVESASLDSHGIFRKLIVTAQL